MVRGMVTQKDILLLLMVLILIGKHAVIGIALAVRWTSSAPTASIGRLVRAPVCTVIP